MATNCENKEEDSLAADIELIMQYEGEPALWDVTSKLYSDKNARRQAVERIDASLHLGVDKIQKKINNLRTYYRRELNKVEDSKRSGSGTEEIYESKWPMFQHLDRFLKPNVKKRKSKSNIPSTDMDQDDSFLEVTASENNSTPLKKKRTFVKRVSRIFYSKKP